MKLENTIFYPEHSTSYHMEYFEVENFESLDKSKCTQSYGVCFCDGKLVLGHNGKKDTWNLVGGTIEKGETPEDALLREIQEESNMKVLKYIPIGYQIVNEVGSEKTFYQLRYFCLVEPFGPFENDPAGTVDKIILIDVDDYKKYFDWREIGDAILAKAKRLFKQNNVN